MKIDFLGQGFSNELDNCVGNQLIILLEDESFRTFTVISAFASYAGIKGLSDYIIRAKKHLREITIVVGVDQKGTSKEALEKLLKLGIRAYVFYQPLTPVFHPKIYLFEGIAKSVLIIGSSNLTAQGLFSNVESSLLVMIDNNVDSDHEIIKQLKHYFAGIFDFSDPNLKPLTNELISRLVEAQLLPNEAERETIQDKEKNSIDLETRRIIETFFPKRRIPRIPAQFRSSTKLRRPLKKLHLIEKISQTKSELVWESGALTQRDLNIPKGANTNPTGSILFKKGNTKGIDQRHYFRNIVFVDVNWKNDQRPGKSHLEKAKASFKIIIDGTDFGDFELSLTHNTLTNTKSYLQKNSMTSLSWGNAKKIIARNELIGKSAKLFKINHKPSHFILEIA